MLCFLPAIYAKATSHNKNDILKSFQNFQLIKCFRHHNCLPLTANWPNRLSCLKKGLAVKLRAK